MNRFDAECWVCDIESSITMGGGSSAPAPTNQTVTNVTQLPQYQLQGGQQVVNEAEAAAQEPYPVYNGQLIAPFSDQQQAGINDTSTAASSYQPALNAATGMTAQAAQPVNNSTISQYMNPYIMQSLAPQLQMAQQQTANNNLSIGQQATQSGAFGDARQGVAQGLNNFYGGLTQADIIGQGLNTGYNSALSAAQQQQQTGLAAGNQMANIGAQNQTLGLAGANAEYSMGSNQQALSQEQLNSAYQQFMNQQNWPAQMMNLQESALSNTPYNLTSYQTLPAANTTAQNLGAFASLAGGVGSLLGGSSTTGAKTAGSTSL